MHIFDVAEWLQVGTIVVLLFAGIRVRRFRVVALLLAIGVFVHLVLTLPPGGV